MFQIETKAALIGINYNQPSMRLSIHQPDARIKIKDPKINIQSKLSTVEIDQTKCFEEVGLYKPRAFSAKQAATGRNKALQGIGQRVADGQILAAVEKNNKAIATVAKRAFKSTKQVNVDIAPKSPPEIRFDQGYLNISPDFGEVHIDITPWSATVDSVSDPAQIYLRQKSSVNIKYVGDKLNMLG